jgi:hypothetical protein
MLGRKVVGRRRADIGDAVELAILDQGFQSSGLDHDALEPRLVRKTGQNVERARDAGTAHRS